MEVPPRRLRAPSLITVAAALAVSGPLAAGAAPERAAVDNVRVGGVARVLARHVEGGYETLVLSVDAGVCVDPWIRGWQVHLDAAAGEPQPWSGVATQPHGERRPPGAATVAGVPAPVHPTLTVVVRRVTSANSSAVLHLYAPAGCGASSAAKGEHLMFKMPETSGLPDDPQAFSIYLIELGQKLRFASAFGAFARARLHALAEDRFKALAPPAPPRPSRQELRKLGVVGLGYRDVGTAPARPTPSAPRRSPGDLAELMSSTADATSLQELIQQDGRLAAYASDERATIPIDKLDGPTLVTRPWRELLDALSKPVPAEPLADATPADFYFARFAGLPQLVGFFERGGGWLARTMALTGFADAPPSWPIARSLEARYLTQLGMPPDVRAKTLASAIPGEVALVGSDPYLREGSDVTLIWRPRRDGGDSADRFMSVVLDQVAAAHGGVVSEDRDEGGVVVHAALSPDGAIHRYRASAGGFELCSNSPGAIRRVLAAIAGHAPRLGDVRAFRYLLARDPGAAGDGLLFVGERFVSRVLGAPLKVLEARRQLALGAMQTPGLAALLFGWINGRAPASLDELLASGLLRRDELAHGGRQTIAWTPGTAVWSSWGTPAALTPLIDLPAPTVVTATERDAYRIFVAGHERDWRAAIGPIAVRFGSTGDVWPPLELDVRTAPFADGGGSAFADFARVVGEARLASSRTGSGARFAIGIEPGGEPRRWLRQLLAPAFAGRPPPGDWLGDWAMVGVEDTAAPALLSMLRGGRVTSLDLTDLLRVGPDAGAPPDLPVYVGVAVRDEAAADGFLRGARTGLAPTRLEWNALAQHRGVAITRVQRRSTGGDAVRPIYYAVCRSTLVVALAVRTLHHLIDDCLEGRLPRLEAKPKLKAADAAPAAAAGAHLVADVDLSPKGAAWDFAGGLVERIASPDDGSGVAEAIFRGAPGLELSGATALATAYLGGVPLTPEGASYLWSDAGVVDMGRGSAYAPRTVGTLPRYDWLSGLAHARIEVSLDAEPPAAAGDTLRSVHVHLTVRRPPP